MGASGKIRVLLAVLFATLLFTAIIIQKTNSPVNSLGKTAETLEHNLQKKEAYINGLINNQTIFDQLKQLSNNPGLALNYIQHCTTDQNIWFTTYYNNDLNFWSGVKVLPDNPALIKEGYSFRLEANAYFEEIKKTQGDFSVIFFIPVIGNYAFQNQYLKNVFSPDLIKSQNIGIAGVADKNVADIKSSDQTYLFSVKLKSGEIDPGFFYYEITIWLLALIVLCILIQGLHSYIAKKGYLLLSFLFLSSFIIVIRFINLHLSWPDFSYKISLFDHSIYTLNSVFPSLGDLCINILFITWFVASLYGQRKKFFKNPVGKIYGYIIFVTGIVILIAASTALVDLFYSLVVHSRINFDISNVLNLSYLSILGILMLCFSFLIFYLLAEVFLTISFKLSIPNLNKAILLLLFIVLATLYSAHFQVFSLFYILWGILVVFRAYAYYSSGGLTTSGSVAVTIFIFAIIASVKLNYFNAIKENENRITFIKKLEAPDDSTADRLFKIIEKKITKDTAIIQYFQDTVHGNNFIKTHLQKSYFNGYLSRYDFKVFEFNKNDQSIGDNKNFKLSIYKDLVNFTAYKFSSYFYRENGSFGFIKYFAIIPLMQNGEKSGNIVIELKSKPVQIAASFPGLLVEGKTDNTANLDGYSYAFYDNGKLLNQSGNFVYNLVNNELTGEVNKYILKTTKYDGDYWYNGFTSFTHLIYQPGSRYLIVVSRENKPVYFAITSITFFFVLLLLFSILVILVRWLWLRVRILSIKDDRIKWNFKLNFDLILYKTRIQFSMIFAVVVTLLLAGIVTFISISNEYQAQQDKTNRDKIHQIATAFENGQYAKYINKTGATQVSFDDFANDYSADLTLFDPDGNELITTEPKIYDLGLQATRMNARAFINLHDLQKSEFANNEKIGLFNYRAFFIPIRNSYKTMAYLELPYFSNEADYREHIGALLNLMINVYAIVFMAIGLFAVFIARQITSPLNFIQYSLSKTIYGQKNEPIRWDRNDEIGALVKEYNKMIAALEHSAQKLAQSERESAWREMAKQVAHEIKNPLTPLKLGLQLLDKSWRDKDPKFDQKFERFSKSFVEQIESLSSIASEFSAFAKMPETKLEQLNVFDMLGQAVTIFKEMDNIKIIYSAPDSRFLINADRDQLLRCFNNLLKNAIEATPPDRQGIIEINNLITSKNIMLTIKDNGQGIPEVMREKIFEPNFTTKSSGTGLGLAFVKNSIENAGGKIWFETITGEGTTFYLSLPSAV